MRRCSRFGNCCHALNIIQHCIFMCRCLPRDGITRPVSVAQCIFPLGSISSPLILWGRATDSANMEFGLFESLWYIMTMDCESKLFLFDSQISVQLQACCSSSKLCLVLFTKWIVVKTYCISIKCELDFGTRRGFGFHLFIPGLSLALKVFYLFNPISHEIEMSLLIMTPIEV